MGIDAVYHVPCSVESFQKLLREPIAGFEVETVEFDGKSIGIKESDSTMKSRLLQAEKLIHVTSKNGRGSIYYSKNADYLSYYIGNRKVNADRLSSRSAHFEVAKSIANIVGAQWIRYTGDDTSFFVGAVIATNFQTLRNSIEAEELEGLEKVRSSTVLVSSNFEKKKITDGLYPDCVREHWSTFYTTPIPKTLPSLQEINLNLRRYTYTYRISDPELFLNGKHISGESLTDTHGNPYDFPDVTILLDKKWIADWRKSQSV